MAKWFVAGLLATALASIACHAGEAQNSSRHVVAANGDPLDAILSDWLNAFNSGDRARIKDVYARYADDPEPVFGLEQAVDTCGVTVAKVAARSATAMTVLLRQHCLPGLQRLKLELAEPGSLKLKTLDLRPLPVAGNVARSVTARIAARLAARDEFAGTLIIQQKGRRLLARNRGLVDKSHSAAITLDTPMFLASAGKMFTAVSILQLVQAGQIELDAPLGRYLADYPNADIAKVTIRQLLTHRGGTGDIGILAREDGENRKHVRSIADMIRLNGSRGPEFPPGTKAEYSNYGFILLGAIIERVSGQSYSDYVREHVFQPAAMTASGFPDVEHLAGVAVGYTTYYGAEPAVISNSPTLPWQGASAGGGVASANDMLRFFDALRAGRLLSPEMLKLATTAGTTPWYGLGFVVNSGAGPSWGHGGNSYGMDVATHYYPSIDTSFICLATRDMVCNRLIFAWYLRTFPPSD